jgi:hypothetical protein
MTNQNQLPTPGGFPSKAVDPSEMESTSLSKDKLRRMSGSPPVVSSNARPEFRPDPPVASNAVAAHAVMVARCGK